MMYVIRDETGKAFTWCTDKWRADLIAWPSGNLRVVSDLNSGRLYWHIPRLKMGRSAPVRPRRARSSSSAV
jgi:hypothetical protein